MSNRTFGIFISRPHAPLVSLSVLMVIVLARLGQSAILSTTNYFLSAQFRNPVHTTPFSISQVEVTDHQADNDESASFWKIDMSQCMSLVLLTQEGGIGNQLVQLQFNVADVILPQLYENKGPCRRVVHADAIEMFGQCYEVNIHLTNRGDFYRCRQSFPDDRIAYRMCVWHTDNVQTNATVTVTASAGVIEKGDAVTVKMFDKPNCVVPRDMGTLVVIAEEHEEETEEEKEEEEEEKEEEDRKALSFQLDDDVPEETDLSPAAPSTEPGL